MSKLEKNILLPTEAVEIYKTVNKVKKISIKEIEKTSALDRGKLEYYLDFLVSLAVHLFSVLTNGKLRDCVFSCILNLQD